MSISSTDTTAIGREVVNTRVFDAPREEVFDAFGDPQLLAQWWGPKGFTNTFDQFDLRPGGEWKFTMHAPSGENYPNESEFREITRPERIVFEHLRPMHWYQMIMTFDAEGSSTRLSWRMTFETEEEVRKIGHFILAANEENFDRLEAVLARRAEPQEFYLTRTFSAPRDALFKAWTDPRQVADWWGPHAFTNPICEIDARPGGSQRIVMRSPEGVDYPLTGNFLEVVEPERLVMILDASEHPADWQDQVKPNRKPEETNPAGDMLQTVTFANHADRTKVTIRTRFASPLLRDTFLRMGMDDGWGESLDSLGALLAKS